MGFFGEGCSCALMVNLKAATTTVLLLYYCTVPGFRLGGLRRGVYAGRKSLNNERFLVLAVILE